MARVLNGMTPKEYAEFMGTYVRLYRGLDLYHDGKDADHLCDGIKEIMDERDVLRAELAAIKEAADDYLTTAEGRTNWAKAHDRLMRLI